MWSHDMIFHPTFPFNTLLIKIMSYKHNSQMLKVESKCHSKILFSSDENCIVRMVKEIKNHLIIERKVRLYERFVISLTCATNAELFGN